MNVDTRWWLLVPVSKASLLRQWSRSYCCEERAPKTVARPSIPVNKSDINRYLFCQTTTTTLSNIRYTGYRLIFSTFSGSAPFVRYAVQTTSEIVTRWPARCPSVAVFNCWRPSFRCGWCSTMEQSATWHRRLWHTVTFPSWTQNIFYLDSHILLFCFSSLPCGPCGFYLGQISTKCNVM